MENEKSTSAESEARMAAYLAGEMTAREAAEFERELAGEPALAAVGEWLTGDAPGWERAEALRIPPAKTARVVPIGRVLWRSSAAAALLAIGFFAGRSSQVAEPEEAAVLPVVTRMVDPMPAVETAREEPTDAPAPIRRRTTDENGRIVIETTLANNRGHATWVVDGNFQLASIPAQ